MFTLTKKEATQVCTAFLKQYHERTQPNETGKIFTALENKNNLSEEQQNILSEWENSLEIVTNKETLASSIYTEQEIFETFFLFLERCYNATKSDDIGSLLGDLNHCYYGVTADPAAWEDWQNCIKQIKSQNM